MALMAICLGLHATMPRTTNTPSRDPWRAAGVAVLAAAAANGLIALVSMIHSPTTRHRPRLAAIATLLSFLAVIAAVLSIPLA